MKLTDAQRRGLAAVRDGKCWRTYSREGNTLHARDGVVSSATLRRLERFGLIKDVKHTAKFQTTFTQELTDAGRKALWHEDRS